MADHPIDPAVWDLPTMRDALAAHDIAAVFRLLTGMGTTQRQIAQRLGMAQSEVSEIPSGRRVQSVAVLDRIAAGLGVPPGWMGLAYHGNHPAPPTQQAPESEEVDEDVRRRNFITAVAGAVVWGHPILHQVLDLARLPPTPLPSRLGASDVDALRDLTERLGAVARTYGGYTDGLAPVALRAERLLSVPAAPQTHKAMTVAVAQLHAMAGWAGFDAHRDDTARRHLLRSLELSQDADDPYGAAYSLYLGGVLNEERGDPNLALKMFQLGHFRLADARDDERAPALAAWLRADSAGALVNMDRPDQARSELAAARSEWRPQAADDAAELDFVSALVEKGLGRIDSAEALAASAVRHRDGTPDQRAALVERITLAQIHVSTGQRSGHTMAEHVIRDVAALRSQRARDRLGPLADALAVRRDGRELAAMARRVATAN